MTSSHYHEGLLYLIHLLINADGVVNSSEQLALLKIKDKENIPETVFENFLEDIKIKKPREIYQEGIEKINSCNDKEKMRAFVHLYKLSQIDGAVHVKEVRLLLYSIKMANIEFDDVVAEAEKQKGF
jgi:uncharacterized tellurite resistance protein B-like protein